MAAMTLRCVNREAVGRPDGFCLCGGTIGLFVSYFAGIGAFEYLGLGPAWFTPVFWMVGLLAYGVAFSCRRLTRRFMAKAEIPDRYELVSSHVAEHYPTDRLGVERLVRLLLFQLDRFIDEVLHLFISMPSVLQSHLPIGNQRIYRTLNETTSRQYVLLTTDRVLRAPPVLL